MAEPLASYESRSCSIISCSDLKSSLASPIPNSSHHCRGGSNSLAFAFVAVAPNVSAVRAGGRGEMFAGKGSDIALVPFTGIVARAAAYRSPRQVLGEEIGHAWHEWKAERERGEPWQPEEPAEIEY
mmetsp:Transcript_60271/g.100041  ORF Transcript_60271/g.100041 Transcript_60271/m.100041 type:complete len:127 (-) Transcript_60271:469-849(-)